MNDLLNFDFQQQPVRIILRDDEPWWIAADVAAILGYGLTTDMTRNLDDDESDMHIVHTSGQRREMTIISESGLYSAIFRSRRAEARAFRRWVTGTVLPSLRRTGSFTLSAHETPALPDANALRAATGAVRLGRELFGVGIARALWVQFGLPLPEEATAVIEDGLAAAVFLWVQGRNHFTNDELAEGIGLGKPDAGTRRRFGDVLGRAGWVLKKRRRNGIPVNQWHAPALDQEDAA